MIDKGIKNPWKWGWLEKKVNQELIGTHIRKLKSPGMAYCELCSKEIRYSTRGWKCIEQHMLKNLHLENAKIKRENYALSGLFRKQDTGSSTPYGIHPMFKIKSAAVSKAPTPLPVTSVGDRKINAESMVIAFAAQNNLSFSVVPELIKLAKTLSVDKKALDQMSMSRTTVSYKLRFGVAKTFEEELLLTLRSNFFSLNIDESTSSNFQKVVTVLVSYFSPVKNEVEMQHLRSFSLIKVNSESLYDKIVNVIESKDIPCPS